LNDHTPESYLGKLILVGALGRRLCAGTSRNVMARNSGPDCDQARSNIGTKAAGGVVSPKKKGMTPPAD